MSPRDITETLTAYYYRSSVGYGLVFLQRCRGLRCIDGGMFVCVSLSSCCGDDTYALRSVSSIFPALNVSCDICNHTNIIGPVLYFSACFVAVQVANEHSVITQGCDTIRGVAI